MIGQTIEALVERVVDIAHFTVNIDGQFFTVSNQSNEKFRVGQKISLYVESANPVRLKIAKRRDGIRIDYNI